MHSHIFLYRTISMCLSISDSSFRVFVTWPIRVHIFIWPNPLPLPPFSLHSRLTAFCAILNDDPSRSLQNICTIFSIYDLNYNPLVYICNCSSLHGDNLRLQNHFGSTHSITHSPTQITMHVCKSQLTDVDMQNGWLLLNAILVAAAAPKCNRNRRFDMQSRSGALLCGRCVDCFQV